MPAGSRVRANNVYGTISDNPLLIGATSYTSLGLSLLPAIVSPNQHAVVVFDPKRVFGEPEIVVITSHTALGTTATITRATYGTTARAHPQTTAWAHVPVGPDDYIAIVTAGTRPSNPFEGQHIFETDTNKLVGYGGVDWAPRDAGGQIGYAQAVVDQTAITTLVDMTSLTAAVTVGTGRRIRVSAFVSAENTTATQGAQIQIQQDGVQVELDGRAFNNGNVQERLYPSVVLSPSAGAHTYKLVIGNYVGGTVIARASATAPNWILIEDIGAA